MGGYEYTPENANKRKTVSLREKHNEASLLMPRLFSEANFDVTLTDPPAPNYSWKGDLSAFEAYPDIHVYEIIGKYKDKYLELHPELKNQKLDDCVKANMQSFTMMEIIPPFLRYTFYYFGKYYRDNIPRILRSVTNEKFLQNYTNLFFLPELTDASNEKASYIFIDNEAPHEYTLLKNNTYEPGLNINEDFSKTGFYDFKYKDIEAYQVNTASILLIAKWLKRLKELSVYDNTKIIIVADHGAPLLLERFFNMNNAKEIALYNPLFMFKDFNSAGKVKTDNSFMTNADTLLLATKDMPVSEINPFTHEKYADFKKKDIVHVYPIRRFGDDDEVNPNYLRDKKTWVLQDEKNHTPSYTVHDNIFDESNWTRIVK